MCSNFVNFFVCIVICITIMAGSIMNECDDYFPVPTIRPAKNFSPALDAEFLRTAMKNSGTDEEALIGLLTARTSKQRIKIMSKYFEDYNKDLMRDLRSELSKDLGNALTSLLYPPMGYLCQELNRALSYPRDTNAITEIVISRQNNSEILDLSILYEKKYGRQLVSQIVSMYGSVYYKRLLTLILTGFRKSKLEITRSEVKQQAQLLYLAGEGRHGTDESLLNKIMGYESYEQLKLIFAQYKKDYGRTVEQAFRSELSGDLLRINLAIVDFVESPATYFSKRLFRAMDGPGTDEATLTRVLISRSEIDLENIKKDFELRYEKTLKSAIESETSGYYRTFLLSIVK